MASPMVAPVMMSRMILPMYMLLLLVLLSPSNYHAFLALVLRLVEQGADVCGLG